MTAMTTTTMTHPRQPDAQVKVFSVLMKKARAMGYALPDGKGIGVQGKFGGATVLNAERGAYLNDIVSALDFASCKY